MARHLLALSRISIAFVGAALVPSLGSAQVRAPDPNATRMMVNVFRAASADKNLGMQAADALRSGIRSSFPSKQIYVMTKEEMTGILEASGFKADEPLAPYDAKALATNLRVEEYINGTVSKSPSGYRLEPNLVLSRDNTLIQPLGVHEGPTLTAAATSASKELKEARKQIDPEKRCVNAAREQKYDVAAAAAREGIAAYPKATLARICLANVMVSQKAPAAELMTVAKEIVALDPRSNRGLKLLAQAYQDSKQTDSAVVTLTRVLEADPTNATQTAEIVEYIASTANPGVALPIINEAVAKNPGDPDLMRLRWRILLAVRNYKEAFPAGEELVKLDTSFADTTYFTTTAVHYMRDSQPQKAAETASRGVAKFPNNGALINLQVSALRAAGQSQQALEALDRAMQAKVAVVNGPAMRLQLLKDLNRTDEILPAARAIIAAGDTTADIRAMVINAANGQFSAIQQNKNATTADWEPVLAAAMYADTVAKGNEQKIQSQFILGAVYTVFGQKLLIQAQSEKSCPLTKRAKDMIVEAQILLPKGGAFQPEIMRTLMGVVMQLDPTADSMIKEYCK